MTRTPSSDFYVRLGRQIRETRRARGKRLRDLAGAMEVHATLVSLWEKGISRIRVDHLMQVCAYLEMDLGQLLKDVQDEMPY